MKNGFNQYHLKTIQAVLDTRGHFDNGISAIAIHVPDEKGKHSVAEEIARLDGADFFALDSVDAVLEPFTQPTVEKAFINSRKKKTVLYLHGIGFRKDSIVKDKERQLAESYIYPLLMSLHYAKTPLGTEGNSENLLVVIGLNEDEYLDDPLQRRLLASFDLTV